MKNRIRIFDNEKYVIIPETTIKDALISEHDVLEIINAEDMIQNMIENDK